MSNPKKKRDRNKEYYVIVYFFAILFLGIIINFTYFMFFKSETFINSPYNSLQDRFSEHVIRGQIKANDGSVLAKTEIDETGNEHRIYPYNTLYAHAVGFDSNGKSGLENYENFDLLRSHQFFGDRLLNQLSGEKSIGDNVVTTLDPSIQEAAYQALGDKDGAVIVIEVESGRILAMVSKPDYDPNHIIEDWDIISGEGSTALFNRATQGQYAPGSTFKMFTLLEYYREHLMDYDAYQYTCDGGYEVDDQVIHCYDGHIHGEQNLKDSFANSCNGSFCNIGLSLNLNDFNELCKTMYFNKDLPIEFASSQSQFILNDQDSNFLKASTMMGQGKTLVSPLHMAMFASAIANDGKLMKPYLVDYTENTDEILVHQNRPKEIGQLITKEEAAFLNDYMLEVVNRGTGSGLGRDAYQVAGKTGTAQVSDTSDQVNTWFVGIGRLEGYKTVAIASVVEDSNYYSTNGVSVTKQVLDACFR